MSEWSVNPLNKRNSAASRVGAEALLKISFLYTDLYHRVCVRRSRAVNRDAKRFL